MQAEVEIRRVRVLSVNVQTQNVPRDVAVPGCKWADGIAYVNDLDTIRAIRNVCVIAGHLNTFCRAARIIMSNSNRIRRITYINYFQTPRPTCEESIITYH